MGSSDSPKGGKARTGTLEPCRDASGRRYFRGKVRLADGTKARVEIPEPKRYDERAARNFIAWAQEVEDTEHLIYKAKLAKVAAAEPVVSAAEGDTWVKTWLADRRARGLTSVKDNEAHYRLHIRPVTMGKHVRDWSAEDMRAIVASLDGKIARDEISAKFASNVWGTATKMVGDACKSKVEALRVRSENPAKDVAGPESGDEREKQFLYPNEFLRLVSCEDVPLRWRRAVALAVYLFPRAGELRALRWDDVDLEHGTVHIHQAFERRSRETKATKTRRGRRVAGGAAGGPPRAALGRACGGGGGVVALPNRMASRLRDWLKTAGVTRPELLDEKSRTTKPLAFHDLRATGLTWMAVRGDQPLTIMQRAGHEDFQTTQIYIRTAEDVREGFGGVFPPLPPNLLGGDRNTLTGHLAPDAGSIGVFGAGHGIRTRDIQLGKLALYQLS